MTETTLDFERQKQAKRLASIERRLMLVELILGAFYIIAWMVFGWSVDLRNFLLSHTHNPWIVVLGFAAVFGGIYVLISLPLLIYDSYLLPHRYGLSTQTFKDWTIDQIKGALLGVVLGVLMIELMYALLRAAPQIWWLWLGLVLFLFSILLANLAPVLLFPIFNKFRPLGEEHADLVERLMRLAEKAKTHVEGVYVFDMSRRTTTANAALTGLGKTRRIILGDTMLEQYDADEIETILAHEMAHQYYKDIPIGMIFQSVLTFLGLYIASVGLNLGVQAFGFESPSDVAAMPLLILAFGFFGLLTMPLENAHSRWRERRADQFALELTGMGDAYASALTRLANQNLSDVDPEPWVEYIFHSHPALGKRIALAKAYSATQLE